MKKLYIMGLLLTLSLTACAGSIDTSKQNEDTVENSDVIIPDVYYDNTPKYDETEDVLEVDTSTEIVEPTEEKENDDTTEELIVTIPEIEVTESEEDISDGKESELTGNLIGGIEVDYSKYVGVQIKDFISAGIKMCGRSNVNGDYTFYAYSNRDTIAFTLKVDGDVESLFDNADTFDKTEEVIAECTIAKIKALQFDDYELEFFIGKTVSELKAKGFEINGFSKSGSTAILTADKSELGVVEFKLDDNAAELIENFDVGTDDKKVAFDDCVISSISYDVMAIAQFNDF